MVNTTSRPFFSITTPCWNSENTIEKTILSILSQTYKNYEYIIVDGGSTDKTLEIIRKYEPQFEGRLHYISEPDKGIYDAINKGIAHSVGVFCWNVNSDDFIEPNALQTISNYINKKAKNDCVYVFGMKMQEASKSIIITCSDKKAEKIYKKDWMIPHPATIVAKEIYEHYGTYDDNFKICADMEWFHRIYKKGVDFDFNDQPIITFTTGGVSTTSNYTKEAKDRIRFFRKKYGIGLICLFRFILWHKLFFQNKLKQKKNSHR